MPPPRSNLGQTPFRGRHRAADAMRHYDALPGALRRWLAGAALPWSPASCLRIWRKAKARGEAEPVILARLDACERRMLIQIPADPAVSRSHGQTGVQPRRPAPRAATPAQRSSTSLSPSNPTRAKRRR